MLKTAKVIGLNSDTEAALALQAQIGDLSFFVIVSCVLDDAFSKVRVTLAEAESTFFTSEAHISSRLSQTLQDIKKSLQEAENLQILTVVIQEDTEGSVMYLLHSRLVDDVNLTSGSLRTILFREGKKIELSDLSQNEQLISGVLQERDRIVMTTQSLVEILGGNLKVLQELPVDNLEDEISAQLPLAQNYPVAMMAVERVKEVPPEIEEMTAVNFTPQAENPKFNWQPLVRLLISAAQKAIPSSKKARLIIGVIFAVFLIGFWGNSWLKNNQSQSDKQKDQLFDQAKAQYQQALSLKDTDASAAAQSLVDSQSALVKLLQINPKEGRALDLKKQLEERSSEVLRIYQVADLPLWLDLDLIKKGLTAERLSFSHGKLLVVDPKQHTLIQLDLETKAPLILAGEDKLGEASLASLNGEAAWTYAEDKGLVRTNTDTKSSKLAVAADKEWGSIADIVGFAGNVYLLDRLNNQIWKYVPIEAGYSDKIKYFKDEIKGLNQAKRIQIDSSIWVLNNSELQKYTQGLVDYFSLTNLDKPIKSFKNFFVSDNTDLLYLLDDGNNRLVVVDKKGVYQSQYLSDKFGAVDDFTVDEAGKKIYLLSNSKIYLLELK